MVMRCVINYFLLICLDFTKKSNVYGEQFEDEIAIYLSARKFNVPFFPFLACTIIVIIL